MADDGDGDIDDALTPEEIPGGAGEVSSERIKPLDIEDELRSSYLTYAMSVIVSRALPDARDGLKPSQRRILVAMNDLQPRAGQPAREVRENLGRHERQLPSARRIGDLPDAGPPGPVVDHAERADRQAGQLRFARRSAPRGHAVHRGPPVRRRLRDARRSRAATQSTMSTPTTSEVASRSSFRRGFRTCWSTARAASPSAWRRAFRRTTSTKSPTR